MSLWLQHTVRVSIYQQLASHAAAHRHLTAHLQHDVDRVIILDIDLHHGNGTQEIAWRLNALAHKAIQDRNKASSPRKGSPKKAVASSLSSKPILQVFYGSLHDVDSYRELDGHMQRTLSLIMYIAACEELDSVLIANASVNISGGGGSQFITNVHLEPYTDDKDFHDRLYPVYAKQLLGRAKDFLLKTTAAASRTVVIVSAGFDASEHEYASMSRHGAKVPTSFFSRFARDAVDFARENAGGKLLAVLEGGYSQRALLSGAASFSKSILCNDTGPFPNRKHCKTSVSGLLDDEDLLPETIDSWWMTKQLEIYEKTLGPVVTRGKRAGMSPAKNTSQAEEDWRTPALSMYAKLKETIPAQPADAKVKTKPVTPPTSSVRATRSRYNSPAIIAKTESTIESLVPSIAVESPLNLKEVAPITPVTSPLPDKPKPSTVFPGATPLIRFTFKAGESKPPQPILGTGQYRDAGRDSSTSGDGDTSGSE